MPQAYERYKCDRYKIYPQNQKVASPISGEIVQNSLAFPKEFV